MLIYRIFNGLLLFSLVVFPSIARASVSVESVFAQCVIDAYSDTGRYFLRENAQPNDKDASYRNWLLLCMRAKGFSYNENRCRPVNGWKLLASETRCYDRMQ